MARRNKNKLLVPDSRQALNQFKSKVLIEDGVIPFGTKSHEIKYEVAKEIGVPLSSGGNGDLSSENAGKIGGKIGGRMVRELVKMAQEELANKSEK